MISVAIQPLKNIKLIPSPISGILEVRIRWDSRRLRGSNHATARRLQGFADFDLYRVVACLGGLREL